MQTIRTPPAEVSGGALESRPSHAGRLPLGVAAAGAGAILAWSGTAIAGRVAVQHIDALTTGVLRSLLAGLVALGIALALRLPRPRTRAEWVLLLVSGVASFALWPMFLGLGLGATTASHAALILAILPVLTGLLGAALERRVLRAGWWSGAAIAVLGTVLLVLQRSGTAELVAEGGLGGDLVILAGTLVCAVGYVAGGRLSRSIGTWATTLWGLSSALLVLVPTLFFLLPRTDWTAVGAAGWGAILYMTFISSLAGYAAWFWALARGGIARMSSWQFAQPALTLALAAWLLGEALTLPLLLCAALILSGTALAQHCAAHPQGTR